MNARPDNWGALLEGLRRRDRRALARIISQVEDRKPGWQSAMQSIFALAGNATIIGITGSPGAGKSTLTGALATGLAARGRKGGILAVDPTSPFTGGAILGDRVRMIELAKHNIFLRSMATRGAMGGLSRATRDVARILDAFGHDIVLIETVGVGQDEVDVLRVADLTVVVCIPGQGDNVQAVKAGIMEIADLFIVNKADRPGTDDVVGDIRAMQRLTMGKGMRQANILKSVATSGEGLDAIIDELDRLQPIVKADPSAANRDLGTEVRELVEDDLLRLFWDKAGGREKLASLLGEGKISDPYQLAQALFSEKDIAGLSGKDKN